MRVILAAVVWAGVAFSFHGCRSVDRDCLFQTSTLNALLDGVYDGATTVGELLQNGDFGIGTFEALDGEMIVLDGVVYQVTSTGAVNVMPPTAATPFACVTFFGSDRVFTVAPGIGFAAFGSWLDESLGMREIPIAVRLNGRFRRVKARSVPRQSKPFPPLAAVAEKQTVFEFEDIEGTVVGFRLPGYMKGINVAGYHLHFISRDRKSGGHLLDFSVDAATVAVDVTPRLLLDLPLSQAFVNADLSSDREAEVHRIER